MPLSFEKVNAFYDVLVKHQNEDGYVVCSVWYAGAVVGLPPATASQLPGRLEEMGCVKVYTTKLEATAGVASQAPVKGGRHFTLMKITGKFTEEVYKNYLYETVTVVRLKPRRRCSSQ